MDINELGHRAIDLLCAIGIVVIIGLIAVGML